MVAVFIYGFSITSLHIGPYELAARLGTYFTIFSSVSLIKF